MKHTSPGDALSGAAANQCAPTSSAMQHTVASAAHSDCHACSMLLAENSCASRVHASDPREPAQAFSAVSGQPLTGRRFVLLSLGVFLVPLALALVGAGWFQHDPARQLAAGAGGLGLGMILARAGVRFGQRKTT